jgi:O-antigen biosynthesis protein
MKTNASHQNLEKQYGRDAANKQSVNRRETQDCPLQSDNHENVLAAKEEYIGSLEKRIEEFEAERADLQNLIKDKSYQIANLNNQNKYLQSELSKQSVYIQHFNNVNNEFNKMLANFTSELKSMHDARATRILQALRGFSLKKLFAAFSQLSIEGNLDLPAGCEVTSGNLLISGWAFAKGGNITRVEAFLDEFRLGEVFYGVARPDIASVYPSQSKAEYGFEADISFKPEQVGIGVKTLKVVVADTKGNHREFIRLVIVEEAKNLPAGVTTVGANHSPQGPLNPELQKAAYLSWIIKNEPKPSELAKQREASASWSYRPLISIVTPVYNTPPELLEAAIESVLNQTYENWELCLADGASGKPEIKKILETYARRDSRVRVKFLETNLGIAGNSNEAIKMAQGEFIALLDHDDELSADALYENVLLLNRHPDADMVYSDEDKLDAQDSRCEPYFKPDWSPDFFCSSMYTCHLGLYRKSLIDKIGGFRCGFDGAQDYDLVLRLTELTDRIYHIPKILYHWRQTAGSTALSLDTKNYAKEAQIKAVSEHFQRLSIEAEVSPGLADNLLRVKRKLSARPKVSIIIPTRDQVELLRNCVNSIQLRSRYHNYEIIIVNNNSSKSETLEYLEEISNEPAVSVIEYPHEFNFAAINNFAVNHADGELLLFLNNDIEVISEEWLEAMVEHAVRPEVGAVGARLLYSNNLIQHAGVIIGIGGVAGHSHKYYPGDHPGYFSRSKAIQNLSAVTAACMMVRAEVFKSLGGFDEKNLAVAFNDVDFCLKIRQKGLLIIYTPYAELYHYESISRGADQTPEKALRFRKEVEYMMGNWNGTLHNDPYYNPNLTLEKEDFSINGVHR